MPTMTIGRRDATCERVLDRRRRAEVERRRSGDSDRPKHRPHRDGGRDGPPPPGCQVAVRHQQRAAHSRAELARQPPPVVEPGGYKSTREGARVSDERLDRVRVCRGRRSTPERRDRQNPGDPMLWPTCRQQDPDQRENDVDSQVGKRPVGAGCTSSASAATTAVHVRAKTAQPSLTRPPWAAQSRRRPPSPRPPSPRPRRSLIRRA